MGEWLKHYVSLEHGGTTFFRARRYGGDSCRGEKKALTSGLSAYFLLPLLCIFWVTKICTPKRGQETPS